MFWFSYVPCFLYFLTRNPPHLSFCLENWIPSVKTGNDLYDPRCFTGPKMVPRYPLPGTRSFSRWPLCDLGTRNLTLFCWRILLCCLWWSKRHTEEVQVSVSRRSLWPTTRVETASWIKSVGSRASNSHPVEVEAEPASGKLSVILEHPSWHPGYTW